GSQQLSVLRVSAEPTGSLRSIYLTGPEGGELERGIQCALSGTNLAANSTVLANCTLTSRDTGWSNWLSMASLFQSRSGRINVEVLVDDAGTPTSFSEHVNISLVSPKSHVILGGFFGATMWAIFLTLSAPSPNERRQQVENWQALSDRLRTRAPDVIDRAWLGFMHILKRAFVGGFVALVLIAVAKGTEGF